MIEAGPQRPLVDAASGIVNRRIFVDPDLYRTERDKVFRRSWLLLGHDSLLPEPHSYLTTTMGEDPVVVWRGDDGGVRAFLNTCPHRGNTLCLFDAAVARVVRCSYHGWSFDSQGRLVAVPYEARAYFGDLDRTSNGLAEVPHVESYGGLLFGAWEPDITLEQHLGELRWWLDAFICHDDLGGLAAVPGMQRYPTAGNWKLFCDNFVGDRYHTPTTHASALRVGMANAPQPQGDTGYFMVYLEPGHGIGGVWTDAGQYERDLAEARRHGPDVVDYVQQRWQLQLRRMQGVTDKPSHFSFGLCFPNFILQAVGGAFRGALIGICHPRGPHAGEVQQWLLIEREAPEAVKRAAARLTSRYQSAAGLVGADDTENFERIDDNLRAPSAERTTMHYAMGIDQEGRWPGQESWQTTGVPGLVGPEFWEVSQRRFYARWAEMMARQ